MCCNTFIKIYVGMGIIDQKQITNISSIDLPFRHQPHKIVKHTHLSTTANELLECVWTFGGVGV